MQLQTSNLQFVPFASSLECFFGSTNAPAEVLDVKYFEMSATVVVLVPPLPPGIVEGAVGPKSNIPNRGVFQLNVPPSVPFTVDPVAP